jgi:methionyl-tRNA formyltransferase
MLKIAYFWTWDFSRSILEDIHTRFADTIEIDLVVSQADKAVWRKQILQATPVAAYAKQHHLDLLQPSKLTHNHDFFATLAQRQLDFIIVVAYWKIVPQEVLSAPKQACINIHGSILPAYRWASPIQESIKNGDSLTWLTIMYMSLWMDEWDILTTANVEIDKHDNSLDIFHKFEQIWADVLLGTLQWLLSWSIVASPQDDSKASYCTKISKGDGEVSFTDMSSDQIYNRFRAYTPWPGIYSFYHDKKLNLEQVHIWEISALVPGTVVREDKKTYWIVCADQKILMIQQVKLEWKSSMDILSFVNGNKDFLDYKF